MPNKRTHFWPMLIAGLAAFASFVVVMNVTAQPSNYPFEFDIGAAFGAYFFTFGFGFGKIGYVIGAFLLFIYLIAWIILGLQIKRFIDRRRASR